MDIYHTLAIAVTKDSFAFVSESLTAVAWDLLPKSQIWTSPHHIELSTPAIGSMTLSRIAPMTMDSRATRVGSTMEIR